MITHSPQGHQHHLPVASPGTPETNSTQVDVIDNPGQETGTLPLVFVILTPENNQPSHPPSMKRAREE